MVNDSGGSVELETRRRDFSSRVKVDADASRLKVDALREAIHRLASGHIDNGSAIGIDRALDVGTFLLEMNP